MDNVTINFLTTQDGPFGRYDVSQEECYNKMKQLMKFTNSKYNEEKLKIYRLRDIILTIDSNEHKRYSVRTIKESYTKNGLLFNIYNETQVNDSSFPRLKKYHSIIHQKNRHINYNGITISFIEERNNNSVVNYIELKTDSSKLASQDLTKVISLIQHTGLPK